MTSFVPFLVLFPMTGFLVTLFVPGRNQMLISTLAILTTGLHTFTGMMFLIYWIFNGHLVLNGKETMLFSVSDFEYLIGFSFDKITGAYLIAGSLISLLIARHTRIYYFGEKKYKWLISAIQLFYASYILIIFSGNLETLLIGWEFLGVASVLLMVFCRESLFQLRNAWSIFSSFRLVDISLVLAMWAGHRIWNGNITFSRLGNQHLVPHHLAAHRSAGIFLGLMLMLAAALKSAQVPFSTWLPRAMEGPTLSGAILYGSLSVHLGVFLLLKTYPVWEHLFSVHILMAFLGIGTAIIATGIAQVQSIARYQIAYATIAQVGFIFVEIAAGFENLALLHVGGNAILRACQLLTADDWNRRQLYNPLIPSRVFGNLLPEKLRNTLYILSVKEWNLDAPLFRFRWDPLKKLATRPHASPGRMLSPFTKWLTDLLNYS